MFHSMGPNPVRLDFTKGPLLFVHNNHGHGPHLEILSSSQHIYNTYVATYLEAQAQEITAFKRTDSQITYAFYSAHM